MYAFRTKFSYKPLQMRYFPHNTRIYLMYQSNLYTLFTYINSIHVRRLLNKLCGFKMNETDSCVFYLQRYIFKQNEQGLK
jgi:hypothetical protein